MSKTKRNGNQEGKDFTVCETPLIITNEMLGQPKLHEGQIIPVSYFEFSRKRLVKSKVVVSRIWYLENNPYYLFIDIYNYRITIIDENLKYVPYDIFSNFYTEIWNVYRIINMGLKKILHIP